MDLNSKRGAVSLGLMFLIFIVIAFIVLIILSSALRQYLIGGLNAFGHLLTGSGNSTVVGGEARTVFVAYCCTGPSSGCSQFNKNDPYNWYIDYNGQNSSNNVSTAIVFTTAPGNYSFTVGDIAIPGSGDFISNNTYQGRKTDIGYAVAGSTYLFYYLSYAKCPN